MYILFVDVKLQRSRWAFHPSDSGGEARTLLTSTAVAMHL
jgi:hypothetical protein